MAEVLELEIATPERELVREEVTEVQIPAANGYIGVLPGHAPLLSLLGTGFLSYTAGGRKRYLSVQGGFVEVQPGAVRVLANVAVPAEEIDVQKARQLLEEAQAQAASPPHGVDPAGALDELAWAQAQIDAAQQK